MTTTPASNQDLENTPFDRALRRLRRDRAARAQRDGAHPLLARIADELLDRLDLVSRPFERALDLAAGPGLLTRALRSRGLDVVAADAGSAFARGMDSVQCDEDRLPFDPASFDLVVSAGTLDSVNDLPGALVQIRRLLKPDGLFLGAFPGAGSLPLLRRALQAADDAEGRPASPRLHPQIDVRAAGDLMMRAGFALPVVDTERVTLRYSRFDTLVGDLRALGWTNLLSARSRLPFTRRGYAAAAAEFASAGDADGRVSERFEIIHVSGWAPSPDQPQPAARGSATHSLARALAKRG